MSRAELKILQLKLWLEPARLGLITSKWICIAIDLIKLLHCGPNSAKLDVSGTKCISAILKETAAAGYDNIRQ